jgi:cytoskeletal protein CcmA (bactofilin family)
LATPVDNHPPFQGLDVPEGMTSIGRTILIKGEVRSNEHLIVEGRIEGRVMVPEHGLAIGKHGNVSSEIMARTITVLGTVRGKITATDRVELLPTGRAEGRIVTRSLIIDEGAFFKVWLIQKSRKPF